MIYGRAFGSCLLIGITHCLTFYIIEPRTLAFIQFIVQFSKVIVSSPHRDDLYILPDVSHLVNTFSQKTKNNFHSSANTGVGNKISVVSHPIQENPYNVYYNINRPVEPPHQLQPKPFHNHHGNSPARSSFPSGAVFARHNASSKKIRKV